ncbi:unnamed protein product [Brassicogethes aeneus]|uniref:Uncharacterized protein n=1 Tax=Brassicogethes aeneus TaxID=1431903 RepID=A0A9P0BJ15_BRAAE|nr:unnamed protein product [Brassicogethes aeneus]
MENQKLKTIITSNIMGTNLLLNIPVALSEDEDDSSTSEDEQLMAVMIIRKRKYKKPVRIQQYVEQVVPSYTAQQFQQHFRITIDAYEHLLNVMGPQMSRQGEAGRPNINVEKQLLAVIWLLATPDSYR